MAYNPFEAMANEWESYFNSIQAIMGEELTEEEKATLENKINPRNLCTNRYTKVR